MQPQSFQFCSSLSQDFFNKIQHEKTNYKIFAEVTLKDGKKVLIPKKTYLSCLAGQHISLQGGLQKVANEGVKNVRPKEKEKEKEQSSTKRNECQVELKKGNILSIDGKEVQCQATERLREVTKTEKYIILTGYETIEVRTYDGELFLFESLEFHRFGSPMIMDRKFILARNDKAFIFDLINGEKKLINFSKKFHMWALIYKNGLLYACDEKRIEIRNEQDEPIASLSCNVAAKARYAKECCMLGFNKDIQLIIQDKRLYLLENMPPQETAIYVFDLENNNFLHLIGETFDGFGSINAVCSFAANKNYVFTSHFDMGSNYIQIWDANGKHVRTIPTDFLVTEIDATQPGQLTVYDKDSKKAIIPLE